MRIKRSIRYVMLRAFTAEELERKSIDHITECTEVNDLTEPLGPPIVDRDGYLCQAFNVFELLPLEQWESSDADEDLPGKPDDPFIDPPGRN